MPERVETRAPTRIDLAGGTIDLWPLYLLHDDPITVNAAIDLFARARIETLPNHAIELVSADRDRRAGFASVAQLREALPTAGPELEFPMRLAAHFLEKDRTGRPAACRIVTDSAAPAGSGLGGSSTLGIALAKALDVYTGGRTEPADLLSVTRSVVFVCGRTTAPRSP